MTEKKSNNLRTKRRIKKPSKAKKFFKIFSLSIIFIVLTAIVTCAGYAFAVIKSTPNINLADIENLAQPAQIFDDSGKQVDIIQTEKIRFKVKPGEIPQHLKDAYVSIEDERFYVHQGVDVKRILGALIFNIKSKLSGNDSLQGGSTLTQQLIKNTVLTDEQKLERKIREAYLSIELEKIMSKDEIITAYLNTIPLGGLSYGVEAASNRYFSKSAKDLTLIESAYLAGITQAPSSFDAFSERNQNDPSRYINRTKTVLSKMLELGKISKTQYDTAILDLDNGKLEFHQKAINNSFNYESFNRALVDQVATDLQSELGYSEDEAYALLDKGGLKIYSTMNENLQKEVQSILDDRSNLGVPGSDSFDEYGTPKLQASAVITDYKTGQVKALIGGRGKQPPSGLNRGYSVLKSVGSSVKPLTAYAPAIDLKLMSSVSSIDDSPFTPEQKARYGGHSPDNYSRGVYEGAVTISRGLARSTNTVAAKLVDKVGVKNASAYGKKFGLIYNDKSENTLSSLALGQFNNDPANPDGSNPYRMANAFGAFGNNGIVTEAKLYTEIKDANGKVLIKGEPKTTQAISPQSAYIMNKMLEGPIPANAKVPNMRTVGKTGTTSYDHDYWFAGLTPYYSASVWVGYDKPQSMNSNSSKTAANIFGKIMKIAHQGKEANHTLTKPDGVIGVTLCTDSGKIPTALCSKDPRGNRVVSGLAVSGFKANGSCDVHVTAKVNKLNNKLATESTPPSLIENRVFLKKPYVHKGINVADYKYLLPTEKDDMTKLPDEDENEGGDEGETIPPTPDDGNGNGGDVTPPPVIPPPVTPPPVTPPPITPPPSTGDGNTEA